MYNQISCCPQCGNPIWILSHSTISNLDMAPPTVVRSCLCGSDIGIISDLKNQIEELKNRINELETKKQKKIILNG